MPCKFQQISLRKSPSQFFRAPTKGDMSQTAEHLGGYSANSWASELTIRKLVSARKVNRSFDVVHHLGKVACGEKTRPFRLSDGSKLAPNGVIPIADGRTWPTIDCGRRCWPNRAMLIQRELVAEWILHQRMISVRWSGGNQNVNESRNDQLDFHAGFPEAPSRGYSSPDSRDR